MDTSCNYRHVGVASDGLSVHAGQLWLYEFTKSYTADEVEWNGMI